MSINRRESSCVGGWAWTQAVGEKSRAGCGKKGRACASEKPNGTALITNVKLHFTWQITSVPDQLFVAGTCDISDLVLAFGCVAV